MDEQLSFYKQKLEFEIDAYDLFQAIQNGENIVVVDARSAESFEAEHIPGAITLHHRTITVESTARLDISKTYVTYCDGIGCNASTKGAYNLAKLGFKVKELIGGIEWWKKDGYKTEGKACSG